MKVTDINVVVSFTDGYQQRFTAACLRQLERREKVNNVIKSIRQVADKSA